jgi:O-acetyl-ADP-ribose deacetylase (regulator of RNase III)
MRRWFVVSLIPRSVCYFVRQFVRQLGMSAMPAQTKIGKTTLRLVTGDIADQETDAVVTAAHWRLNKGTGTDGTIHTKGGPRIYEECRRIGGCPIGDAVITTGGDLKARHVIHAVGPVWRGGDEHEPELLASAYRRSLEVAVQHGLRSISFPSISTGAFVYPLRRAAPIALRTIIEFLEQAQHDIDEVRMVLYTRENDKAYTIFAEALEQLLSQRVGDTTAGPCEAPDPAA